MLCSGRDPGSWTTTSATRMVDGNLAVKVKSGVGLVITEQRDRLPSGICLACDQHMVVWRNLDAYRWFSGHNPYHTERNLLDTSYKTKSASAPGSSPPPSSQYTIRIHTMAYHTWDMAVEQYYAEPRTDFGSLFVEFVMSLDTSLRHLFWWLPVALLKIFLEFASGVALSGVQWFEFSPWAFYLLWLPSMVARYVAWVWTALRILRYVTFWLWKLIIRRTTLGWLLELSAAWFFRGSLAPPPTLEADVAPSLGLDRGENAAHILGMGFAAQANVVHASITAGGLTPSRFRKRSVWTNRLQKYLGGRSGVVGELVNRRWTPDLPNDQRPTIANALLGMLDCEAKLLGGGVMPSEAGSNEVFLVVETNSGRLVICPELLANLALYACFRPRTQELLLGLRSRAREWFSKKEIAASAAVFVLPDTVACAFKETAPERLARERLDVDEVSPSP